MILFNKNDGNFIKRGIVIIGIIITVGVIYTGSIVDSNSNVNDNNKLDIVIADGKRIWPVDKKKGRITSGYGIRVNPVTRKTSFHSGIDIGLSQGEKLYAISSGVILYSGFKGAYGYTLILKSGDYEYMYTHLEPEGLLEKGIFVNVGDIIAKVGPKYISKGPYMDSTGRYTNGLTTGPHLHLGVKYLGNYINPLSIF